MRVTNHIGYIAALLLLTVCAALAQVGPTPGPGPSPGLGITLGSTAIPNGGTATTIAGLTLTSPILTTPSADALALTGATCNGTGFDLSTTNTIGFCNGGTQRYTIGAASIQSATSGSFTLVRAASTCTAPSLVPNGTAATTGVGSDGTNLCDIVGGGAIGTWSPTGLTNTGSYTAPSSGAFVLTGIGRIRAGGSDGTWQFTNSSTTLVDTLLVSASGTWQLGGLDAASPTAQMFQPQSVAAGNGNTAGASFTIAGSKSNGSGGGDVIFQTTLSSAASGTQNTLQNAIVIKGGTQNVQLPRITSDSGLTDASVCEDTTNHALFAGSGTLGICLGTSSRLYKTGVIPMQNSLSGIMNLRLVNFRYKHGYGDSGARRQNGLIAEEVAAVFPDCTLPDKNGPNHLLDWPCVYFHGLKAQQEMQAEMVASNSRIAYLENRLLHRHAPEKK